LGSFNLTHVPFIFWSI
jgi:mitogen-activated protein kinase 3